MKTDFENLEPIFHNKEHQFDFRNKQMKDDRSHLPVQYYSKIWV